MSWGIDWVAVKCEAARVVCFVERGTQQNEEPGATQLYVGWRMVAISYNDTAQPRMPSPRFEVASQSVPRPPLTRNALFVVRTEPNTCQSLCLFLLRRSWGRGQQPLLDGGGARRQQRCSSLRAARLAPPNCRSNGIAPVPLGGRGDKQQQGAATSGVSQGR